MALDIKRLRKKTGLTQIEFGAKIERSQSAIASYESRPDQDYYRVPDSAVVCLIKAVYGDYLKGK